MRPIMFIQESLRVSHLLQEFRAQHLHIAIVHNEQNIFVGLVTLEDALEEIVGEINDEHEAAAQQVIPLKQGGWAANGSIPLEKIEAYFGKPFRSESSVTLGGF